MNFNVQSSVRRAKQLRRRSSGAQDVRRQLREFDLEGILDNDELASYHEDDVDYGYFREADF